MQHFDGEIEKFIRSGVIDYETGLAYATLLTPAIFAWSFPNLSVSQRKSRRVELV